MRGHEALIALRLRGKALPVSIGTDDAGNQLTARWREMGMGTAFVSIGPTDRVASLDLRFVVGLEVWIDGRDAHRVAEVFEAVRAAGASRVLGATMTTKPNGESEVASMLDTKGVLTWPE